MPALDALTAYFTPVEDTESKLKSTTTGSMESMCQKTIENDNGEDMGYNSKPIGQNAEGEIHDKNSYQRECGIDMNAYERETVMKYELRPNDNK